MRLAFSKSLHAGNRLTFTFIPLPVIVPLRGTLSCAFGAALLQGPTHWGLSRIGFHTASWIHPPPSARPFSKGLPTSGLAHFRFHSATGTHPPPSARPFSKGLLASDYLTFAFIPLRGSILRLRRGPSPRAYSVSTLNVFSPYETVLKRVPP